MCVQCDERINSLPRDIIASHYQGAVLGLRGEKAYDVGLRPVLTGPLQHQQVKSQLLLITFGQSL